MNCVIENLKSRGRILSYCSGLDLVGSCPTLLIPNAHLVTVFRGPTQVCSAVDLDMKVSDGGIATPCLVDKITPMSPAEVKALPAKLQP